MGNCATHHRDLSTPLRRLTFDKQHRAMFRPNLYHRPPDHPDPRTINGVQQTPSAVLKRAWGDFKGFLKPFGVKVLPPRRDTQTTGSKKAEFTTNALEVWFPGCHSGIYFIRACPPFRGGGHLDRGRMQIAYDSRLIPQMLAGETRRTLMKLAI